MITSVVSSIAGIVGSLQKWAVHFFAFMLGKKSAENSALKDKVKTDDKVRKESNKEGARINALSDDDLDDELHDNR